MTHVFYLDVDDVLHIKEFSSFINIALIKINRIKYLIYNMPCILLWEIVETVGEN